MLSVRSTVPRSWSQKSHYVKFQMDAISYGQNWSGLDSESYYSSTDPVSTEHDPDVINSFSVDDNKGYRHGSGN
jgi:hypothetical protein